MSALAALPPADVDWHEVYLERLARHSDLIVRAVRTGDRRYFGRFIDLALAMEAPSGVDPAVALITVLAAQVDPDVDAEQRLGWIRALTVGGAA